MSHPEKSCNPKTFLGKVHRCGIRLSVGSLEKPSTTPNKDLRLLSTKNLRLEDLKIRLRVSQSTMEGVEPKQKTKTTNYVKVVL